MKRSLCAVAVACAVAVLSLGLAVSGAEAKPEFATKEKVACPICHVMSDFPKKRNPVGECYKRHGFQDLAICQKDPTK